MALNLDFIENSSYGLQKRDDVSDACTDIMRQSDMLQSGLMMPPVANVRVLLSFLSVLACVLTVALLCAAWCLHARSI
jgi:hypothetical protein